mgnify:FL=1
MKIQLEFTEEQIVLLTTGIYTDFSSEQPHRFEVLHVRGGTLEENNQHDQAIRKFVNEHDGEASLSFVGDQFLTAKIYAAYWTEKLNKKCNILWDTNECEYAVWVPLSLDEVAGCHG